MNILQRAEYAALHGYLEYKFRQKLGAPLMVSTFVQDLIAFVTSVISTGSGTITTPGITETVAGFEVTEQAIITAKKA